jgi:hypothetical protein
MRVLSWSRVLRPRLRLKIGPHPNVMEWRSSAPRKEERVRRMPQSLSGAWSKGSYRAFRR